MGQIDVCDLGQEELSAREFPVAAAMDFRMYLAPEVHRGISLHARHDTSIEICGVLVGNWYQDENGPYALIEDYIRCDSATSKFAEVTFTHESWAHINQEMDSRFEDKRIVGWYHSHPDFGIFLSDRDCFIHEHFFSSPGQVAYVVDPVRDLEGAFAWKEGKPKSIPHYWVGKSIRPVHHDGERTGARATKHTTLDAAAGGTAGEHLTIDSGGLPLTTTLLSCLAIFLLGYLVSGWGATWERRAIIDGVVSNYTKLKLVKIGLREELAELEKFLAAAVRELRAMPAADEQLTPEQQQELTDTRKMIANNLVAIRKRLESISGRYGYTDAERLALMRLSERIAAEQKRLEAKSSQEDGKQEERKPANPAEDSQQLAPAREKTPQPSSEDGPEVSKTEAKAEK